MRVCWKEEIIASKVDYQREVSRELKGELNITANQIIGWQDLAEVEPYSGLIDSVIHVIYVNIKRLENVELQKSKKISAYRFVSLAEIKKMRGEGAIVDGFILSAVTLLRTASE